MVNDNLSFFPFRKESMKNIFSVFKNGNFKKEEAISGLTPELKVQYVVNLLEEENTSILFVCSSLYEANQYFQKFLNYTQDVYFFPMDDFLTSEALAISPELKITRLETLKKITEERGIIVTNLMGYLRYLPPKDVYLDSYLSLKINEDFAIETLVDKLYSIGYSRETIVNKTGEIAVRGYVVDIFPIGKENPIRIEYWGDTIESIRTFNVETQLTIETLKEISISPNTEFLIGKAIEQEEKQKYLPKYIQPVHLFDYLENPLTVFNDYQTIESNVAILFEEIEEYRKNNEEDMDYMFPFTIPKYVLYFLNFDNEVPTVKQVKKYESYALENFQGPPSDINKRLNQYIKNKYTVIIYLSSRYLANRLIDHLENPFMILTNINELIDNKINVMIGQISEGYIYGKYVVISEKEIFNKKESSNVYKTNFKIGSKVRDINKLEIGDYIVHNVHGIGRYCGIKTLTKNGLQKDYLMLEYKGGDKLYIPVEKLEIISKYSSSDGIAPKLNKLGGVEWQKTKLRVKQKLESIASDLLELYALRESTEGFAFQKDDEDQIAFEKEFVYEETQDQLRVIDEIKKDMESSHPMDRLLCGDVGYGKTEVAFRAIFKAIMSGKQVAFLCPTTILSNQHYYNALERFKSYPANIQLLNRFVTPKKQKEVLEGVKTGTVDVLIGTHRILSDDVEFKNLGLLVIDEEQRFGVKHKEKIKQYKNNIDVLTLSATPIPRTLQMSMTGVRSLSLIETPPTNRYPIQTYVLEENKQIMKDAIYKELARNGQIFILYNYIEDMEEKAREIQTLVPEARIICAHGKMDKQELEDVMIHFMDKEYDILLCTTIIETGIDIPSVNTLIIIDADRFGLSQLYQIRGRVGRSNKIAYCYLMYNKGKILSDVAKKRLNVIKEFTELGSGFSIAMRDLAIRGAGDILGQEQAGFVDSVGVELFIRMLNDEVKRLKGEKVEEETTETQPLLEVATTIADDYVSEEELKIEIHKMINEIHTEEDFERVKKELEDRFGTLSEDILIYMREELFETEARTLSITKIIQTKNFIEIHIPRDLTNHINGDQLFLRVCSLSRKFRFGMKNKELTITLDTVNLDKHYIYYLLDLLKIIKESRKITN